MIFNNLGLNDLKIDLFLCQIVGRALLKNFDLSTNGNDLKVTFYQIDFCPVKHFIGLLFLLGGQWRIGMYSLDVV